MTPNPRILIYQQVQAAMRRVMTPSEKMRLDKLLDDFDVSRR